MAEDDQKVQTSIHKISRGDVIYSIVTEVNSAVLYSESC